MLLDELRILELAARIPVEISAVLTVLVVLLHGVVMVITMSFVTLETVPEVVTIAPLLAVEV